MGYRFPVETSDYLAEVGRNNHTGSLNIPIVNGTETTATVMGSYECWERTLSHHKDAYSNLYPAVSIGSTIASEVMYCFQK